MPKRFLGWGTLTIATFTALVQCTGDDPVVIVTNPAPNDGGSEREEGAIVPTGNDSSSDASCGAPADPKNCGTCGHDCLGGACAGGACVPTVLVSNELLPSAIAVAQDTLYWTWNDGTIRACETSACGASVRSLAEPSSRVDGGYANASTFTETIGVDATHVYWPAYYSGMVFRCSRTGCPDAGPEAWVDAGPGNRDPTDFVLDATHLYWTEQQHKTIWRCLRASCVPELVARSANELPRQIAIGGPQNANLYVISAGYGGEPEGTMQQVLKTALDASTFTTQYGIQTPTSIAVTQGNVFYASEGDGGPTAGAGVIYKGFAANQAAAAPFVSGLTKPRALVLDDTNLYWASGDQVLTCPRAGCVNGIPRVVASGQDTPYALAVDSTQIYWVNQSGGQVMHVAK